MLLAGSDDGVYRFETIDGTAEPAPTKVFDSGAVQRLRTFDAVGGTRSTDVFAATKTGLGYSPDGETWTDLGVPTETVYSVGASADGDRLYAGTRPARVYVADVGGDDGFDSDAVEWRECDDFQELPSREEWQLPRHENVAQVRDVHPDSAAADRVVAGVEVGGVHASDDGGETWEERRTGVDDDIHELRVVGPGEYVAATGFGLFRTTDGGDSWTRLDDGVDQRYFRSVCEVDGVVYAGGALENSSTWNDPDADPELFAIGGDTVEPVDFPRPDETVTGMTSVDGDLVVGTHRGSVLARRNGGWDAVGDLPVGADQTGLYTPLTSVER